MKRHALQTRARETLLRWFEHVARTFPEWLLRAFAKATQVIHRVKYYKVWQDGNKPILLQTNEMLEEMLQHIHQNPVAA
jgi:putative transposase